MPEGYIIEMWDDVLMKYVHHHYDSDGKLIDVIADSPTLETLKPDVKIPKVAKVSSGDEFKYDGGKMRFSIVPPQIISDISEVREYGISKYGDSESWKKVEIERYGDALFRHYLKWLEDPESVDEESGIKHYKHMACNVAFICQLMTERNDQNGKE